jgi:ATP-dependent RNA helicase DHX8/PRP22
MGGVYRGKVTGMMQFGCFVELTGFRQKVEGLVHLSNISAARVNNAADAVQKGQDVWVKVVSMAGSKLGLSMRDCDQKTGKDLLDLGKPKEGAGGAGAGGALVPGQRGPSALVGISGIKVNPEDFEETTKR